ncbi:MAG: beta-ketoacyl-ACP synthase III [Bacteroidia bacterium]|nr:beta-ketoacyl-ACP synthase III [Bacteroidia bacterium]
MQGKAYITRLAKFLPNEPIENEEMEQYLGMVGNEPSKARRIVLRSNGITKRYYVLDRNGQLSHNNAQLAAKAIENLYGNGFSVENLEMIACGTSLTDHILPSLASAVHGEIKGRPMEIFAQAGACCSGMHALKFGYLSVISGNTQNAVSTGSEMISPMFLSKNYEPEYEKLKELEERPIIAFEKEFLRWMLSDGAGAALIENKPNSEGLSLEINWIETVSFAHELETCMYAAASKRNQDGSLKGWKEFGPHDLIEQGVMAIKQDVRLLEKNIAQTGAKELSKIMAKRGLKAEEIDYLLPHISSEFFRKKVADALDENGIGVPQEKWFTNLTKVGNVGAASIYLMLEELFYSGQLQKGQKVLCLVPESARFSYAFALLTVC